MKNKSKSLEQLVAKASLEIISCPEFSCLPDYNKDDVIASISYLVAEAVESAGAGKVDRDVLSKITCSSYRDRYVRKDRLDNIVFLDESSAVH